jgi:hypothetical protein
MEWMNIRNSEFEHRASGHKICFGCRLRMDSEICQCGKESINFGKYFEVPSHHDLKKWVTIELAYGYFLKCDFKLIGRVNNPKDLKEMLMEKKYFSSNEKQKEFENKKKKLMERYQNERNMNEKERSHFVIGHQMSNQRKNK